MTLFEILLFGYGIQINGAISEYSLYRIDKSNGFEWKLKRFYSCPYIYFRVWKIRFAIRVLIKGYS